MINRLRQIYLTPGGIATQREFFLLFLLPAFLLALVASYVQGLVDGQNAKISKISDLVFWAIALPPFVAITRKRMREAGVSWLWVALPLAYVVFCMAAGEVLPYLDKAQQLLLVRAYHPGVNLLCLTAILFLPAILPDQGEKPLEKWRGLTGAGRLSRGQFARAFGVGLLLVALCAALRFALLFALRENFPMLTWDFGIGWLFYMLLLNIQSRRLHDLGWSHWIGLALGGVVLATMCFISALVGNMDRLVAGLTVAAGILFVQSALLAFLMLKKGMIGQNRYGADPLFKEIVDAEK